MKIRCINTSSPRSDGITGNPTGIRLNQIYKVAEVLDETGQYSIINDDFKISRYSQYRFEIIDPTPVKPLREEFNYLTREMRIRIKQLESQLAKAGFYE